MYKCRRIWRDLLEEMACQLCPTIMNDIHKILYVREIDNPTKSWGMFLAKGLEEEETDLKEEKSKK